MSHRVIAPGKKGTNLILREDLENIQRALRASYKSWGKSLLQLRQEVAFRYLIFKKGEHEMRHKAITAFLVERGESKKDSCYLSRERPENSWL